MKTPKNAIFTAYKPPFISSNAFLTSLKKKYNIKKAGFSGTLDPFARGCLIIAFGQCTKLLEFINTEPKIYNATLWLGAKSKSLDIENITSIAQTKEIPESKIYEVLKSLQGEISYTPPIFSAKKINGKRAYELARAGKDIDLKLQIMQVFSLTLLNYNHPFLHFQAQVSKGAYIRSLAEIIANKLGSFGTLSSLERVSEGGLKSNPKQEIFLDGFEILPFSELVLDSSYAKLFYNGAEFELKNAKNGIYKVKFDDFFSIIEVQNGRVRYLLNRMDYAHTLKKAR